LSLARSSRRRLAKRNWQFIWSSSPPGDSDREKEPDAYRGGVLAAVQQKVATGDIQRSAPEAEGPAAPAAGGEVIDLAALLAQSIQVAQKATHPVPGRLGLE
jgi:non-homologous end joining protein Ku